MKLLQMSLAGGVMILVITVIRALAIERLPKKTFLALWAAALARLLAPVSLPSALSIYSLLARRAPAAAEWTAVPALPDLPVAAETAAAAAAQQTASAPAAQPPVWMIVWAVGAAVCAVVFAVAYGRCCREFRASFPVENDVIRRWLQSHPLRRTIAIRQSGRISSPLTFGVLRPVILVPKKTDWTDETALRYVLEHEFVHIQRFDVLSKLLLIAAVCVHWFNPLVWVMYVLANRDLELSCDETVLRRFGGDVRAAYARVLIRMEAARGGFAPLCNHFGKNAIEERITAIMKTKRITIVSLGLAALLVAGTVTVFATSAKRGTSGTPVKASGAFAEENAAFAGSGGTAVESGVPLQPDTEYTAAGISSKGRLWYYAGQPVAMIYDDNDSIYMDEEAAGGGYLHVRRDSAGVISGVDVLTKEQFRELADQRMNAASDTTHEESTLMSYVDPADGRTYYSFDGGKTFEPLTDAEFEARFPTPDVVWWTYDEYKAWLDNEKVELQSLLGQTGGDYTWTQQKIDETIALYESILKDIQNGVLYSKTVDGSDDVMLSMNPADIAQTAG
ncbi:MAG: M56 family metallopeptidase [Oscillospiraceae bacterium]|nr:M56 family metallopeptidase [Oscillospiraceae bacterium]